MRFMRFRLALLLALLALVSSGCAKKGTGVYRTWTGPDKDITTVVTLNLDGGVGDITIRERELARSDYGTVLLVPGKFTIYEQDEASIEFVIRPMVIDMAVARAAGELVLGHSYTLNADRSDGRRVLWIQDDRSGEIFIDTR